MKCPACTHTLSPLNVGNLHVDVCQGGCGGVWFDAKELYSADEPHEEFSEALLNVTRSPNVSLKPLPRLCPKDGEPLVRQFFDHKAHVEIDLCWTCGGVWLDTGELKTIRSQFKTMAERQNAANAFSAEVLKEHQTVLSASTKRNLQELDAAYENRFRSIVSFISSLFDPLGDGVFK
jgi:Zn-finger nucleic acid-binding protein